MMLEKLYAFKSVSTNKAAHILTGVIVMPPDTTRSTSLEPLRVKDLVLQGFVMFSSVGIRTKAWKENKTPNILIIGDHLC